MSSAGRAANSDGCVIKPKECGIGLRSCFVQIQSSLLTGSYVMATAEQREPYESRGSRTVLGEPGGESPPGHSSTNCRRRAMAGAAAVPRKRHSRRFLTAHIAAMGGRATLKLTRKKSSPVVLFILATRAYADGWILSISAYGWWSRLRVFGS